MKFPLILLGILIETCVCTRAECSESTFKAILASVPESSLNYVAHVPANGSFGDAASNVPFPQNATMLPELCAASVNMKTSQNTSYDFGVFLPAHWNARFMMTGNGGLGGGINWLDMGLNQPEKLINWGYRAIHGSATAAKTIIGAYYMGDIQYSYYASCSTGGRQGLKEIQLHPETFDGVVVGAPAWWTTHLQTWTLKQGLTNFPDAGPGHIPESLFSTITDDMLHQCDTQDGLLDQVIGDPLACNFDFNQLLCQPNQNKSACLTAAQIGTAEKLYRPYLDPSQNQLFPGISLGSNAAALSTQPTGLGIDFLRYWVFNDSNWDFTQFKIGDVALADAVNPGNATADNFDLSPFLERGGKLIHYHGLADPLRAAESSQHFYNQVYRTLAPRGVQIDDFYRFFFIPGMSHCMGSDVAPWYIGGGTQFVPGISHSVPGFMDRQHDVILAIMAWVEKGDMPDQIIATKFRNDTDPQHIASQRPICSYPRQARYDGWAEPGQPSSWKCLL
ncbi:unnamed protein product [Clonostachys rosea]|uniref:Carboxylic ester hydrolase n=1 Tax=Bionectria ochroleuca TaxID=29856 RepID=A0ABY6TXP1_BIOOC|nr:unnamed protein product [Clonostachys rosea]